jgi:transcription elongation factor Elf1
MAATVKKDMTEMRKVLECPICMTFAISGQIKQCKNGHHICENCASRLDKIDTRRLPLENIRDVTPIPCQKTKC